MSLSFFINKKIRLNALSGRNILLFYNHYCELDRSSNVLEMGSYLT